MFACIYADKVICHNPPLPGLLVQASPVLNHNQTDHKRKQMEHRCKATIEEEEQRGTQYDNTSKLRYEEVPTFIDS